MKEIVITENESGQRLDRFLRKYLNKYTLGEIYKLLRKNLVKVNGKKQKENYMLVDGDILSLYINDNTVERNILVNIKTSDMLSNLDIVYEDQNILIISKPIGLLCHPDKPADKDTLISRVLDYLGSNSSSYTFSPALCNRLDRNTGGLVIAAKNYQSLKEINRLIRERKIKKYYICIVKGKMTGYGELKGYLLKDEKSNKVIVSDKESLESKFIHTKYRVIHSTDEFSLMEVELITGRSHQIRAHFASIGHPLIGDFKYGCRNTNALFLSKYNLNSQFLFAYKITFKYTENQLSYLQDKEFTAKLTFEFDNIVSKIFKQKEF